jgi:drug/metabolite transporter (DMT)-like permease
MSWIIYAFLTAIFTSIAAIIQKKTLNTEHAMEFSTILSISNLIFAIPLLFFADYNTISFKAVLLTLITSILGSIAFLLIAKSTRHLDVSIVSPFLILGPGITSIIAFLILGEKLTLMQIYGIALLIIGSYVLELKPRHNFIEPFKEFKKSKYLHFVFLALILYGITATIDRYVLSSLKLDPNAYLGIVHIFIAINFVMMLSIFHDGIKGIKSGIKKSGKWILLVSFFVVLYRFTQMQATKLAYVGLVISIKRISSVITTIIGGKLFHEKNLIRKTIACLIMIVGAIILVL